MPFLGIVGEIVAATPQAWVTIGVAALTGILGFLSGAAAAAVVTTTYERSEHYRTRLVEAAQPYVEALNSEFTKAIENHNVMHVFAQRVHLEVRYLPVHFSENDLASELTRFHTMWKENEEKLFQDMNEALSKMSENSDVVTLNSVRSKVIVLFPSKDLVRKIDALDGAFNDWRSDSFEASNPIVRTLTIFTNAVSDLALRHTYPIDPTSLNELSFEEAASVGEATQRWASQETSVEDAARRLGDLVEVTASQLKGHEEAASQLHTRHARKIAVLQDDVLAALNAGIRKRRPERPRRW